MDTNFLNYLEVFQVCDSTFPIGTFNHSFGMENYLFDRRIKKGPEFKTWLKNYYKTQFKYGEGLLVKLSYEALEEGDFSRLLELDHSMDTATIAKETRVGTRLIAQQMLTLLMKLNGENIPFLKDYQATIKQKEAYGNPAIVFALYVFNKGIGCSEAIALYGYSVISTMVQNAVRAIPLGQFAGQEIVLRSFSQLEHITQAIQELDASYLGANTPGLELAQMKHETQVFRLFMS